MSVKPPRLQLPPLNALRAFEASARLGGISKAADELCVTPGAVAQHVKTLEDWAGAPLFQRHAKGVALNDLGQSCLNDFEAAFDQLNLATQNLRIRAAPNSIRIAALPSLAQLWLSPRMPELRAAFPEARISISALEQAPNMAREGYDLSVFLEPVGRSKGVVLADDRIFPVCNAELARRLQTPADIGNFLWLKDATWKADWQLWLDQIGIRLPTQPEAVSFSLYSLAVAEACNGAGVLMGHEALVARQLADGDLVAPFDKAVPTGNAITARLRAGDQRRLPGRIVKALAAGFALSP